MNYLIHVSLLLAGCFIYYRFILQRETFFKLHRCILLAGVVAAFGLPLIPVPAAWSLRAAPEVVQQMGIPQENLAVQNVTSATTLKQETNEADLPILSPDLASDTSVTETSPLDAGFAAVNWQRLLRWGYLAGLLVFLLHFLVQLGLLFVRMLRHPGYDLGSFKIIELNNKEIAPYSFWNRIFLNPNAYDPDTYHQIIQHEKIHLSQRHTLDMILAELLVVVQWFNPFAWWYRTAIEDNLEFLTDAEMLRQGTNPVNYQLSLVKVAVPNHPTGLTSNYNQTLLEKRITMMKSKQSSVRSGWKYLALLPLLLFAVLQLNAVIPQSTDKEEESAFNDQVSPVSIETGTASLSSDQAGYDSASGLNTPSSSSVEPTMDITIKTPNLNLHITDLPAEELVKLADPTERKRWTAVKEGDQFCFQFTSYHNERGTSFNTHYRCFATDAFGALPQNTMGEFSLTRNAGTLNMRGMFEGDEGSGTFDFTPDNGFKDFLRSKGYSDYSDEELVHFFYIDFTPAYLTYLNQQGYQPNDEELLQLAIFSFDLPRFKSTLSNLNKHGYPDPELDDIIALHIHDVSPEYIEELSAAGYPDLDLQELLEASIHGLDADYISEMAKAGLENQSFDDIKQLSIMDVDPGYIAELAGQSYTNLDSEELIAAKIHGVNADFLKDVNAMMGDRLSLEEAISISIHDIDASFINLLQNEGFNGLDLDDILAAKIHDIDETFLRELDQANMLSNDLEEVISFSIHGVTPQFINSLRELGYGDLNSDDYIAARIHNITPEFIKSYAGLGFNKISFDDLVALRIHKIKPEYIRSNRDKGDDIDDFIRMKIHRRH